MCFWGQDLVGEGIILVEGFTKVYQVEMYRLGFVCSMHVYNMNMNIYSYSYTANFYTCFSVKILTHMT